MNFDSILSKILLRLVKLKNDEINTKLLFFVDYGLSILNLTNHEKTSDNLSEFLYILIIQNITQTNTFTEKLSFSICDFMRRKSEFSTTVKYSLK